MCVHARDSQSLYITNIKTSKEKSNCKSSEIFFIDNFWIGIIPPFLLCYLQSTGAVGRLQRWLELMGTGAEACEWLQAILDPAMQILFIR